MNKLEKKLYKYLSEGEETVKNKKTGNVYTVKKFDPDKHEKPTPAEVEKTKAANGGKLPSSDPADKSAAPKKQPTVSATPTAEPQKIAAADFKTSAEKNNSSGKRTYSLGKKSYTFDYDDEEKTPPVINKSELDFNAAESESEAAEIEDRWKGIQSDIESYNQQREKTIDIGDDAKYTKEIDPDVDSEFWKDEDFSNWHKKRYGTSTDQWSPDDYDNSEGGAIEAEEDYNKLRKKTQEYNTDRQKLIDAGEKASKRRELDTDDLDSVDDEGFKEYYRKKKNIRESNKKSIFNKIEKKLYELVSVLAEKPNPALDKEISYKAKDGTQKKIVARNALRLSKDHPAHIEAEKIVQQSNKDSQKSSQKEKPGKIAGKNFRTDAEKDSKSKSDSTQTTKRPGVDDTKLKSLMPGIDTSVKTLDQNPIARQQLSVKIDELAKLVNTASTKDEKESIDACIVTVPGTNLYCDDNLGIPRVEMPQFKGNARPGSEADKMPKNDKNEVDAEAFFKKFLNDSGISVNNGEDGKGVEVPPDRMKATQRDMQAAKILGMLDGLEKNPEDPNLTAPIMVSNDGYVLDGHHRWAAMVAYNAKHPDKPLSLKATIIDKPIQELVPIANKFADGIGIEKKSVGKPKEPQKQPTAEKKNLSLAELLTVKN